MFIPVIAAAKRRRKAKGSSQKEGPLASLMAALTAMFAMGVVTFLAISKKGVEISLLGWAIAGAAAVLVLGAVAIAVRPKMDEEKPSAETHVDHHPIE